MYPTTTLHEDKVAHLAARLGLELVRDAGPAVPTATLDHQRYHLVTAQTRSPVYPGGPTDGTTLADLEDWLHQPWE